MVSSLRRRQDLKCMCCEFDLCDTDERIGYRETNSAFINRLFTINEHKFEYEIEIKHEVIRV